MGKKILTRMGAVGLLGVLVAVGMPSAAHATRPVVLNCGSVITENTVLAADIGPCNIDAVIVGASNITLNLNGHTISGTGVGSFTGQAAGVLVDRQTGVTVTNGTVTEFFHGVRVFQGSGNFVNRMTAVSNRGGNGILFESTSDNRADANMVIGNGRFSGMATFDNFRFPPAAARNSFTRNTVKMNNAVAFGTVRPSGISIENGPGHLVSGNTIETSGANGVRIRTATLNPVAGAQISQNRIMRNGADGISAETGTSGHLIERNVVTGNRQVGIRIASQDTRIIGNSVRANAGGDLLDTNPNCDANTWSGNAFGTASPDCARG